MRCPLRFGRFISEDDEECQRDCAWLVGTVADDKQVTVICAMALTGAFNVDRIVMNEKDAKGSE